MKILALEFSSEQRSAAMLDTSSTDLIFEAKTSQPGGTKAFALIEDVLRQANCERKTIECIAVGLGPGSYAGIRIAIAIAQGWQLAREINLLGVSSVEAIAWEAQKAKINGTATICIDAQRGEFYLATYSIHRAQPSAPLSPLGGERWGEGAARDLVPPLHLATAQETKARADAGDLMIGPEVTKWFPAGRILSPTARAVAALASSRTDFVPGDRLEPIYLRETSFVKAPPARTIT